MALPPLSYNVRSLYVRGTETLLTVLGIGATVAVVAGVLALQQGFAALYTEGGRGDVVMFLRPGATSEGESSIRREQADIICKELPEIAQAADGRPLAGGEVYLAVRLRKSDGGETNVPIRGVSRGTVEIFGPDLVIAEGRMFEPGADEVIVGESLVERLQGCKVGGEVQLNTTRFRVVGVFHVAGPYRSEIFGDVDRIGTALKRENFSRVIARVKPGTDIAALARRVEDDKRIPAKVLSEPAYLKGQTAALSYVLWTLGAFLGVVMGTAAAFTGTNSMLAAITARIHEIGVLLSIGFRPFPIFLSFLVESIVLGLIGGALGCLLVLPLHGVDTGTTNFQTFTEVAFAFRVTPSVLGTAVVLAMILGLVGGLWPAWQAARSDPVEALRRR